MYLILLLVLLYNGDSHSYLKKKISNHGNWANVKSMEFNTNGIRHLKWQGYTYSNKSKFSKKLQYHYSLKNEIMFHQADLYFPGGYHFDFKFILKDKKVITYNPSGSRAGRIYTERGEGTFKRIIADIQYFFPVFALKKMDPKSIHILKNGAMRHHSPNGDSLIYHFNAEGLVKKIDIYTGKARKHKKYIYSDYRFEEGKWIAYKLSEYESGGSSEHWEINDIKYNTKLDKKKLKLPSKFKKDHTDRSSLKLTKLRAKTHLLENIGRSRNSLIYELNDGLLISDAPLNDKISKKIIEKLQQSLNKPVSHVFLSHHHNDHINGFTEFYRQGAKIIFNRKFYQAIIDLLQAKNLKINNDRLIPFDDIHLMENGNIEFRKVDNGHADGLSFLYLPKEKLIYQGDFFTIPSDGFLTKPIQATIDFNDYIKKHMINFNLIISHHAYSKVDKKLFEKMMRLR